MKRAIYLYKVDFFLSDQLSDSCLGGIVLLQMLTPANTAPQGERALLDVVACDRVWHLQWAVLAVAVLWIFSRPIRVLVARLAEPSTSVYTTAVVDCNGAAVHALPINVIRTVSLFADIRANAHVLDQAWTADEILTASRILHALLLLTVDQTTKVGLLAPAAHVKADLCFGKLHEPTEIKITWSSDARVFVQMLVSRYFHCLDLHVGAQNCQLFDLLCNFVDMRRLDWLLAHRAQHEVESDSEGRPLMFEQLEDAVCVKDMTT